VLFLSDALGLAMMQWQLWAVHGYKGQNGRKGQSSFTVSRDRDHICEWDRGHLTIRKTVLLMCNEHIGFSASLAGRRTPIVNGNVTTLLARSILMVRSITGWIGFRIWCEALYYGRQEHDVEVEVLGEEEHDNIDNCPTYRERQPCWTD